MRNRNDLRVVKRKNGTVFTMFRCFRRWFKIPSAVVVLPPERGPVKAAGSPSGADSDGE